VLRIEAGRAPSPDYANPNELQRSAAGEEMTRSQGFMIPNSDFSLEGMTCSRSFLIHNSDFLLGLGSVRQDFIIHNSDFLLGFGGALMGWL
jgi:hypothetical protein